MRHIYRLLLLMIAASLALPVAHAQQTAPVSDIDASNIPLESLLNPDGTINRDHLMRGSIDVNGWRMTLGPNGEPRFVRESTGDKDASPELMEAPGDEAWDDRFGPPGINGPVYALAIAGNDLYVGGAFTIAGNALATNFARWDGSTWSAVGDGASGPVYTLTLDGDVLYIGGQFLSAGGTSSRCIVQYNVRTGYYAPMGAGVYGGFVIRTNIPLARVHAIAVKGDSVFVAGWFNEAGPSVRTSGLACWNSRTEQWSNIPGLIPDGAPSGPVYALELVGGDLYAGGGFNGWMRRRTDGVWSAPFGLNDSVFAIEHDRGSLYVAGQFTRAGGVDASRVARYEIATEAWSALAMGFDAPVYAIAVDGDTLYAGGAFSATGFLRANGIARWSDGAWTPVGEGVVDSANAAVRSIALVAGGLYAGGKFRIAGRATVGNIAYWNGSQWRAVVRGGSENVDRNGTNGTVYAMAVRGNDVYVAGDFTMAGGVAASRVARWNGDEWSALGEGIGDADALVRAIAIDSSGAVYVGGIFSSAGGAPAQGIARWDGAGWSTPGGGVGGDHPYVFALAVKGNTLVAGGAFTTAGAVVADRVARYDIVTRTWSAIGDGIGDAEVSYAYVTAIGIDDDTLYVGGSFTSAGGRRAFNVARVVGGQWSALGTGVRPGANAPVAAIAVRGDDVFIAGSFTAVGSDSARYVARFTNGRWYALGAGLAAAATSLALDDDGSLVVGGTFTRIGSLRVGYIARWNDTSWSGYAIGTNGPVQTVVAAVQGVYAGGRFTLASGLKANNVALYDFAGWTSLGSDPASGILGTVLAAAIDAGDVYVGGLFGSAGGVRASGVARWDGQTWRPLGRGVDGPVRAIAIRGDEVYVGGEFTRAGGVERRGIARWSRSARQWSDVGGGLEGTGPYAFALAFRGDELLVGGSFARAGGVEGTARVARWNATRGEWSDVGGGISGSGYYTYVSAIGYDSSGRLYVAGIFPIAGSTRVNNIAMWDGDWHPLGKGLNSAVYDIAINGSDLYAVGEFLRAGDVSARRVARWDGTTWLKHGGDGFDRRAYALCVHDGVVYAAGEFLTVDDIEVYGITRWDGAQWLTLGSGLTNPYKFAGAYALAVDDSSIYVGGNFTVAGRTPSFYFARWVPGRFVPGVASVLPPPASREGRARMLEGIVPNPSSLDATLHIRLAEGQQVRVELYALDGFRVATIVDGFLAAGEHRRPIESDHLPAGMYVCRLVSRDGVESIVMEVTR